MLKELNGERENEAEGNLIKPTSVKILPQTMKKDWLNLLTDQFCNKKIVFQVQFQFLQ